MEITEKVMRPIVEVWLQGNGYYVAHEVMLSGYCDLTGCKWAKRIGRKIPDMVGITAVELKIRDIKGVLRQSITNSYYVDYSFAAMPLQKCESMRKDTIQRFTEKGIGLLGVNNCVKVIIPAKRNEIWSYNSSICRRLWSFKLRHGNNRKMS